MGIVFAATVLLMGSGFTGAIAATPVPTPAAPVACTAAAVSATVGSAAPAPAVSAIAGGVFDGVPLTAAQVTAAQTIVSVGQGMHIDRRGVRIALAEALQESSLNPDAVNGPYRGLFQQKADIASGLYTQYDRADPAGATRMFFTQLLTRVPGYAIDLRPDWQLGELVQETNAGRNVLQWFGVSEALNTTLNPPPLKSGPTKTTMDVAPAASASAASAHPRPTHPRARPITQSLDSGQGT